MDHNPIVSEVRDFHGMPIFEHTIRFPEEVTLRDTRTGQLVILQESEFTITLKRGNCMLCYKEQLNR